MDCQLFRRTAKTTVGLLSLTVIGLCAPATIAQEEIPTVERLNEITIPQGTVEQLAEIESRNSHNSSFAIGGTLPENTENETFELNLDSKQKYYFFGRKIDWYVDSEQNYYLFGRRLGIHPHFEDWLTLNHGEGPRGYVALPIILF